MIKRFAFLALMVALIMMFSTMAMADTKTATVSLTVPAVLTITDLDDFIITLPNGTVPGTATGSDTFTVDSNGASGVAVTGSCSTFSLALVNTALTTITNGTSAGPGSITPTAIVDVDVVLADAPGARTATLTITAVDN